MTKLSENKHLKLIWDVLICNEYLVKKKKKTDY